MVTTLMIVTPIHTLSHIIKMVIKVILPTLTITLEITTQATIWMISMRKTTILMILMTHSLSMTLIIFTLTLRVITTPSLMKEHLLCSLTA